MMQIFRFSQQCIGLSKLLSCVLLILAAVGVHASPRGYPALRQCSSNQTGYDFIVIGGGTAGLAVSTRLSQRLRDSCILVIEAGEDGRNEPGIYIPGKKTSTFGTKYDWNLTTVPQPNLANRALKMVRGKVLGGSSALNLMVWDRGSKADYDAWEELGNEGWNWKNMYRSMLKVENFAPSPEYGQDGVARGGPIQTLINRILPAHQLAFPPVMKKLGLKENDESLNGKPNGVSRQPTNIRQQDYTRSYSPAYLEHASANLILQMNARVARINFKGKKATGITLEDGTLITANKEVILSTGTFQSPAILEISGIGNRDILIKAGIESVYHLPGVGENLQDHPRIQSAYILKAGSLSFDRLRYNTTYAAEQLALYTARAPSEYDYTASAYAFFPWSSISPATSSSIQSLARNSVESNSSPSLKKQLEHLSDNSVPQVEIIFSDGYTGIKGYPAATSPLYGIQTFTIIGGIMHPFSRGSVHISSSSISTPPTIDPAYLSSPVDLAALVTVAKYLRRIATTAPLAGLWETEYEPGSGVQSDLDWEAYVRNATSSIYHPIGTCAMLAEKEGGVVSPELKVYGIDRLRVVDASVFPMLLSGHIQTAVYGVAERAADMIAGDWE